MRRSQFMSDKTLKFIMHGVPWICAAFFSLGVYLRRSKPLFGIDEQTQQLLGRILIAPLILYCLCIISIFIAYGVWKLFKRFGRSK